MIALLLLPALAADCPSAAPLEAEIADLERALAATQLQTDILRAQRIDAEGEATPWPEGIPAAYREEAVAAHISEVIARAPVAVSLAGLDCSEWPCVALLYGPHSPDNGVHWAAEELKEAYPHARRAHGGLLLPSEDAPGPNILYTHVYLPERDPDRQELDRITHRFEVLRKNSQEEAAAIIDRIRSGDE
jgi:hypothetical protein